MAEYIDRGAFLAAKRKVYCADCDSRKNSKGKMVYDIGDAPCRACSIGDILDDVEDFPAADVVERRHGEWGYRWKVHGDGRRPTELFPCSECGYENTSATNFCPNCGADMREES